MNGMEVKIKRILVGVIYTLMKLPMSGYFRGKLLKLTGVKMVIPSNEKLKIFVGENVIIDNLAPQLIEIGNWTTLATGCVILTHFIDTKLPPPGFSFKYGKVKIGYACFIGANTIICNSVEIGDNSIVAAGSVVTKNIPPNEIWGGNPAKYIKTRSNNINNAIDCSITNRI